MIKVKRLVYLAVAILVVTGVSSFAFPKGSAALGVLEPRSLTLQTDTALSTSAQVGGSDPGGTVDNSFQFTVPLADQSTAIGSISFQYCVQADNTCGNLNTTDSMSTTSATLGTTSSALSACTLATTPIQLDPVLNCATAVSPGSSPLDIQLVGIVNPNVANLSFYVRITTWTAENLGGTEIDSGNVAASTANPIVVSGQMPESLVFCTGATVSNNSGGVPSCPTATAGTVGFSKLFSPTYTDTATSQMAASTNAGSGYQITVAGDTLTSGSYTINAIGATAAAPVLGEDQFGLNLVQNTTTTATPAPGAPIAPASDGVSYFALPTTNYGTADQYAFHSGDVVATSGYPSGTSVGTDAQIYTVTYIANVQGKQQAGTYTSTLTYICTPTF